MGRKSRWCLRWAVLGWLLANAVPAYGSGFALYEAGARSSSLAGAMVARADDLSAIFYNPAGLVQLPKAQLMCGFTTFVPRVEIATHLGPETTPTLMQSRVSWAPHVFASYQAGERVWLGFGLNSPFGLGVEYDASWPGNVNLIKATIQTLNLNPTVAVKITDYLSVGAGLDIMYLSFNMERLLPLPLIGPQALDLQGGSWGLGFNLGVLLKPCDYLSLGISYRSQVRQQVHGHARFRPYNDLDSHASGSIILPDMIFAGIMVRPLPKLSIEGGVVWTHWELFNRLDIKFSNSLGVLAEPKQWQNTWRGQLGVEYKALPWLDLRAGYAFEVEPMPDRFVDYLVPTTDRRHNFAVGTGFHWRAVTLDLSYVMVLMMDRTVSYSRGVGVLPADFQGRLSHVAGMSLSYKF
jgi:long-chain fatty acid transport protein